TRVEITPDLHYAKVFISVIGSDAEKQKTIEGLQQAAAFIAITASKKMTIRYFPALTFKLDTSVDAHLKIEKILGEIENERKNRSHEPADEE
ncbi:MAG TPA: 30S ribosome-binding factor RbfA, partial [Chlamydiales bacterium]|nr:30S ribosome-binding factor RbfA [Chlamydiales bacterium]